jgi:hypothetical protein
MDSTDNPVMAARDSGDDGDGDVESTPLLAKLAALEARVDQHDEELRGGGKVAATDAAVRAAFSRLGQAPCNWHQAVIFFLSTRDERDAKMRQHAHTMVYAGLFMITFQFFAAGSVLFGALAQGCETNKECASMPGTFCGVGGTYRCGYCGHTGPFALDPVPCDWTKHETRGRNDDVPDHCWPAYNLTEVAEVCGNPIDRTYRIGSNGQQQGLDPQFHGRDVVAATFVISWCEACVSPTTGAVDMFTLVDLFSERRAAITPFDWLALAFSSYIVALTVFGELKDISLCQIAIEREREELGAWRHILLLSAQARKVVFLPVMLNCILALVCTKGADALSVCFNTLAVLFLVEIE